LPSKSSGRWMRRGLGCLTRADSDGGPCQILPNPLNGIEVD
jgi:hypothetical protein